MTELWKPLQGYAGYFEISNLCRVRKYRTHEIIHTPRGDDIDLAPRNRQVWPYGYTKPDPQQLQTEGQGHVNDRNK